MGRMLCYRTEEDLGCGVVMDWMKMYTIGTCGSSRHMNIEQESELAGI